MVRVQPGAHAAHERAGVTCHCEELAVYMKGQHQDESLARALHVHVCMRVRRVRVVRLDACARLNSKMAKLARCRDVQKLETDCVAHEADPNFWELAL